MKKYSLLFLAFLFGLLANADNLSMQQVLKLGLNVLDIKTVDQEEPTCEMITHPPGSMGTSITNVNKVPGNLKIYNPDGSLCYDSGEYEKGESGMTIKVRGNTSAYQRQKPYKIKLQKKADLLLRGNKDFNDKNWVLLKDNQLNLYMGYAVSRLLEEAWTPAGEYVNVMLNGDYRGMYYLVESIERNEKCRINVSDRGYVMEHDPYWWNENGEYVASVHDPSYNFTFKYPDYEDLTVDWLLNIVNSLHRYEDAISNETYSTVIDIESFAKWFLGHDIIGTSDGGGTNLYLSKYDDSEESLIKAGPLWDFDTMELTESKWSGAHTSSRFNAFFRNPDTELMETVKGLWYENGEKIYLGILDVISDYLDERKWRPYRDSSSATGARWNTSAFSSIEAAKRDLNWFPTRFEWLKRQLGDYREDFDDDIVTGIRKVLYPADVSYDIIRNGFNPHEDNVNVEIFSVDGKIIMSTISTSGQPISVSQHGLYIVKYGQESFKIMVK